MTTWVITAGPADVRVAAPLPNGKLREIFSVEGGAPAELAGRLRDHLTNNPEFDALVLSAPPDAIRIYREALEPDISRFLIAEESRDNSGRDLEFLKERHKKHADPKGRSKKWR